MVNSEDLTLESFQVLLIVCIMCFQLFDLKSLELKKTYKTDRPVNSAAISPIKPHVSISMHLCYKVTNPSVVTRVCAALISLLVESVMNST
jgi:hypothetical protein